ncbi:DUF1150 family protein [Parvularcula sp. ZS-1/3]|uniref:DUF1150 family protein n=1 Tax=Parvularcula mediterranea TaxID=2732508 RepID=A0A7Y3RKZ3_9PROT|nr:DUF1150 family protein [Parvularcula mediterranea]NNU15993.1 DUF1150 family protein [Parvularcula mediterranea]
MTTAAFENGDRRVCYVREVLAKDVREDIEAELDADHDFEDDSILWALCADDGSRIALMSDRDIAFAAARQHEMMPHSVH